LGSLLFSSGLHAQVPRIELQPLLSGLSQPIFLTSAPDGSARRFIVEQPGRIRVLQPGATASTVFLDIRDRLVAGGERGLLGLAFHPQFASNGRFFVNYTRRPDGATVIAEFRVSIDPNVAEQTEIVLLTIPQPFENHNGGMIEFGPDGFLYIGMGDGGSGNDPGNRAQNIDDLLGKILRIDVNVAQGSGVPYSSPPDNPFFGASPGRDEIYAVGMRNPWRFSFDRTTGQLYVGDVGQNTREEIDIVTRGGNYGWRVLEGTRCNIQGSIPCSDPRFVPPVAEYSTGVGGRCSVTGGYVYRGAQQSLPPGAYIYGDYCSGEIFMLRDGVQTVLLDTNHLITSFGEDESGELYVVAMGGSVHRITNPDAGTPVTMASFSTSDRGVFSISTSGLSPSLLTGYARIQANSGAALPGGVAVFELKQNGVLVSETAIPASPLVESGRFYAEIGVLANTGIAIANPNDGPVTISFHFTDANGSDFNHGVVEIPARQQVAAFLSDVPFNAPAVVNGTFTFRSNFFVSAVAIRGFTNSRGEFLMSALPMVQPGAAASVPVSIPHFAEGAGWSSRVVLVNPTGDSINGTLQFLTPAGGIISSSAYAVAPRAAVSINSPGGTSTLRVGSVRILPQNGTPSSVAILTLRSSGVVVSEEGIPGKTAAGAFRAYVETSAAIQPAVAVANLAAAPAAVRFELTNLDGSVTGFSGLVTLPANGQSALFLNDIPGLQPVGPSFKGLLRIVSDSPSISAAVLRTRTNERGEFLFTEMQTFDETAVTSSSELLFPHLAEGFGFSMRFALFAPNTGITSSGTIFFFDKTGQPLAMFLGL
jgi:glucose/arabinose dehydrogenase